MAATSGINRLLAYGGDPCAEASWAEPEANGAEPLVFGDALWYAADKLRGTMDASEYKHVV